MDVDWSKDEIIIYPTQEEISEMFIGKEKHRVVKRGGNSEDPIGTEIESSVTIQPENPNRNTTRYYDDVLLALGSALRELMAVEAHREDLVNSSKVEKLRKTYHHYKKQQEKYGN